MVRVGIVGIGFMGMIHYLAWQKVKNAQVVAIASRDEKKLAGDWRSIQGNFGPPGQQMDLAGVKTFRTLEELLADPQIDLVDVCLPPDMHCQAVVAALQAGKHVICEKPIALEMSDAIKMVETAQSTGKQFLIAHIVPFFDEYAFAYQLIKGGKYGRMLGGHFKRIIVDPAVANPAHDPRRIGGPMIDVHIHDAHFICLACGMPRAVFTSGRLRDGLAEFFTSQFLFDDANLAVTATSGVIRQPGRSFTQAFEIQFERATLLFDFAVVAGKPELYVPLTLLTDDGKVTRPEMQSGDLLDAFVAELSESVEAIRTGRGSALLDGRLACDALVLCHKQTESLREKRVVELN